MIRLVVLAAGLGAGCVAGTSGDKAGARPGDSGSGDSASGDNGSGDNGNGDNGSGDNGTGSNGGESGTGSALDAILTDLRADAAAAELAVSRDTGWPAPVDGGYLFVFTAPGAWSLAGDHSGWSPEAMTCEAHFCWLVREAAPGGGYKYTNGSEWVPDPWSRAYTYDDNGEMSLVLPTEGAHLERAFAVEGEGLQARDLHIWVPDGPVDHVLYAHDGQNLFDPAAIWGGWHLQDSAPPGMLIVGIDNTSDRFEEYTHDQDKIYGTWYGGEGDVYARFLQDDVRPLIRARYGEPAAVGTLGSSLGGLISFYIADLYPGEYTFAASMSGTMGWGSIGATNETMIQRYAAAGHRDTALYVDSGGYGDCYDSDGDGTMDDDPNSADNYCENLQLRDTLEAEGYTFDVDLWHWWEPDATHDEVSWGARVFRPLEIFAGL